MRELNRRRGRVAGLVLTVAVATTLTSTVEPAAAATLVNHTFETSTQGWATAAGQGALSLALNGASAKALQGTSSAYLYLAKDLAAGSFAAQRRYTLTAQVRRASTAGSCALGIKGDAITDTKEAFTNAAYATVSLAVTPSAVPSWVQVYLEGQASTCVIDNVRISGILNDTFETGGTSGWAVHNGYGTATTIAPGTSAKALRLSPSVAGGYSFAAASIPASGLSLGTTYRITGQARRVGSTGGCVLGIKGDGIPASSGPAGTSWTTVTRSATASANPTWAQAYLEATGGATCVVDNVKVTSSTGGTSGCTSIPKPGGGTWTCTFSDEFDGAALDSSKWSIVTHANQGYGWGNACLVDDGRHVVVSGGTLRLVATSGAVSQCAAPVANGRTDTPWKSGAVQTKGKFSQTYGRFEMRAKLPPGRGMWPAFWMMPQDDAYGGWPSSGEIDIMEALGHQPSTAYATLHYIDTSGSDPNDSHACTVSPNWSGDFHTYTLEWSPTTMTVLYDGAVCHSFTGWQSQLGGTKPFDKPFFIILDLAVGGSWPGDPDGSTPFPGTFAIDYIRAWK